MFQRVMILLVAFVAGCSGPSADGEESATAQSSRDAVAQIQTVQSPDGNIQLTFITDKGVAKYSAKFDDESVVGWSRLGLRFAEQNSFDDGLKIVSVSYDEVEEQWEQPWGENHFVRDHHNEIAVEFANEAGAFTVRARVFDDGFGFRYELPDDRKALTVTDELTEFAVPADSRAWWIPARMWNRYEYIYSESPVDQIQMVHTPVTFRTTQGTHLSIHEAALVDYSGMSLEQRRAGVFKANLAPSPRGGLAHIETPFVTPWRTVTIADGATGLLNSSLILNLNEPNALGDVSWVEPGKYVGIWWAMHIRDRSWGNDFIHGATTDETIRYMDFAAENGFKGVLVEGWNIGWDGDWYMNGDGFSFTQSYPDFDIDAIAEHGKKVGVRLIGHHETSGSITNYERQMADAFRFYEDHGVRQVKTGYVADAGELKWIDDDGIIRHGYHDGQYSVNHHIRVLKEAAKHKISINSHEPVKDTGLRRTYPNWISREGARGSEYDAWGVPPNPPSHTAILPYTRMLSGPMDYTPGIFELRPNELPPVRDDIPRNDKRSRIETTLMKQLALYVVLYSPIQMVADLPEHYQKHKDAFQFIVDVPTDWERSIALDGEVGQFVVMARQERDGEDWYVGALTNEQARSIDLDLSAFLEPNVRYEAQIYRDGPNADYDSNPYDYVIERKIVTHDDAMSVALAPGGGAAIRFARQP